MYQYLICLVLTASASAQFADCFAPDGNAVPLSRGYQPCISTQNVDSMCCVLNITVLESLNDGYANFDKCLTNGMCQDPNSGSNAGYYRGSCTDKTWKSPNCLNACTDTSNGGNPTDIMNLWACPDGSWCCGLQNSTCCDDKLGFQLPVTIAPYITSAATSTSLTSTSTPTGSSLPSAGKSDSNKGVSIGLGVALGVLIIVAAVMGLFVWRKTRMGRRRTAELRLTDPKSGYPLIATRPVNSEFGHEAPGDSRYEREALAIVPSEMDGEARANAK